MNRLLSLLLLLSTGPLFAQETARFLVLDAASLQPIPYVNLSVPASASGTVGDADGHCTLTGLAAGVSLHFSALGYRSSKAFFRGRDQMDTVYLQANPVLIAQVELSSRALDQEVILGVFNENRGGSIGFANAQLGAELGALIPIEQETYLKSAHFQLNHAKGDSLLLRLNIYDYSQGIVGENLLTQNVLIREKQRRGKFTIDLRPYEVIVDHPVLLSLEWLRDFDELGNKAITFDVKKVRRGQGTFIRFYSNGPFEKMAYKSKYQPCFYLVGQQAGKGE